MDKVGLRELLRVAEETCQRRAKDLSARTDAAAAGRADAEVELVLDRLTQLGLLLLHHRVTDIWEELCSTLVAIFRLGLPADVELRHVHATAETSAWLMAVIKRVLALGAVAVQRGEFHLAAKLVLQKPVETLRHYYWLRYTVTTAARAEFPEYRAKQSLIPPAAEYVRGQPALFQGFDENIDRVVNAMCQFDFWACALVVHLANDTDVCYPNFGVYWNHRTTPIVRRLIEDPAVRAPFGDGMTDDRLAMILRALDDLTGKVYFSFSGWDSGQWDDQVIVDFLKAHST
jgi:hypothetical protein